MAFFVRLRKEFVRIDQLNLRKETELTNQNQAYKREIFKSVITVQMLIRLAVMFTNLTVTFILRDHPYIWSVVAPKMLYELVFTALNFIIAFLMIALFLPEFNLNYFCKIKIV